jgi:hypothetical protein
MGVVSVLLGGDLNATINEPLFQHLKQERFLIEECNDRSTGTT